ncbi:hypothetical protein EGR_02301 [Echinococcus granulosus]|uniref:Uncharacterized protein n=1 Tax=Echinococcus granulosus TaxID=6210 RepID=W6UMS9_ECHGR|nr:hypothetical protein EGR_02301 [Echinococcus granulosus]EUB62860.1 hypothetical protein EGR_02301 [Echinococcus granulosus]
MNDRFIVTQTARDSIFRATICKENKARRDFCKNYGFLLGPPSLIIKDRIPELIDKSRPKVEDIMPQKSKLKACFPLLLILMGTLAETIEIFVRNKSEKIVQKYQTIVEAVFTEFYSSRLMLGATFKNNNETITNYDKTVQLILSEYLQENIRFYCKMSKSKKIICLFKIFMRWMSVSAPISQKNVTFGQDAEEHLNHRAFLRDNKMDVVKSLGDNITVNIKITCTLGRKPDGAFDKHSETVHANLNKVWNKTFVLIKRHANLEYYEQRLINLDERSRYVANDAAHTAGNRLYKFRHVIARSDTNNRQRIRSVEGLYYTNSLFVPQKMAFNQHYTTPKAGTIQI